MIKLTRASMRPFFYGLAETGASSLDIFLKVYLLVYFNLVKGMPPTTASLAIGLSVFWDAIIDPWIGVYSDRYYAQHGHRRSILYFAAFSMCAFFILIWQIPQMPDASLFILLFFASSFLNSSISLFSIPYIALANDLELDDKKRQAWIGWRVAFANIGSVLGLAVPAMYFTYKDSEMLPENYMHPANILAGATLAVGLVSTFFVYKDFEPTGPRNKALKIITRIKMKELLSDKLFLKLVFSFFTVYCAIGLNSTLALYYYRDFLNLPEADTQKILVSFLIVFTVSLPLWIYLTHHFSKRNLIIFGGLALGFTQIGAFPHFDHPSFLTLFLIASLLCGVLVGVAVILEIFLSDFLRDKEIVLKRSVAGQYLGIWKMVQKMSRAVAVGLAGPIIQTSVNKPQLLAQFFGWGVGLLFIVSAIIMAIPIREENQRTR